MLTTGIILTIDLLSLESKGVVSFYTPSLSDIGGRKSYPMWSHFVPHHMVAN